MTRGLKFQSFFSHFFSATLAILFASCQPSTITVPHHSEVVVENLGPNVNSPYDDFSPTITADGKILYFTSTRPLSDGTNNQQDFWFSRIRDGNWSMAENVGAPVNTPENEGSPSIAPDGQTIYFAAQRPDSYGSMDIYVADLRGTRWSNPRNLGPNVNTEYWESQPSIASDGRTLYFVSDRPGGYGGTDIWVTVRSLSGEWSQPTNLGPEVNTAGDEASPFIAADGKTLYFSSNGHPGMGGLDMFVTRWDKDHWTTPVNMGTPLNSEGDDRFYSLPASGRTVYFSSDRPGGFGGLDIYAAYPNPFPPGGVTTVAGVVTDARTGRPLGADITLEDLESGEVVAKFQSNDVTGEYLVVLPAGRHYGVTAEAPDHLFYSDRFDVPVDAAYKEVRKDIQLDPLVGTVRLNVFFDFDKSNLKKESIPELKRAVRLMQQYPKMVVEVAGHTDSVGNDQYNQRLSEARANAVRTYLIQQGIEPSRVIAKGYGRTKPVASNATEEGRARNRRVEFHVLKK